MLVYNSKESRLENIEPKIYWCIFLFTPDQTGLETANTCSLIYDSFEKLRLFLTSKSGLQDLQEWIDKGFKIRISPHEFILV